MAADREPGSRGFSSRVFEGVRRVSKRARTCDYSVQHRRGQSLRSAVGATMNEQPWSYFLHFDVPSKSTLDAYEVRVAYDDGTDTLFSDLWPLRGPTISCLVSRFIYLRIELSSRLPVGTQVEDLTRAAIFRNKKLLELAAVCSELFQPSESASRIVTPEFKLDVIHSQVVNAARAYDRRHGIGSDFSSRRGAYDRQFRGPEEGVPYVVTTPLEKLGPGPKEDSVVGDFASALEAIEDKGPTQQDRELERILLYWSDQPNGSIKQRTGELLVGFIRQNQLGKQSMRAIRESSADYLLRAIKAG
jgi:hypothetical protein